MNPDQMPVNSARNESGLAHPPIKGEQASSAIMMENEKLAQVSNSLKESISRLFHFKERMLGPENSTNEKSENTEPTGGDIGMLSHSVERIEKIAETIEILVDSLHRI